jgi:RHS repeat-associated protein
MPKPVTDNLPGLPPQSDEYFAELRKAQAEQKARDAQAQTADGESNFYTGKPYDAELGGYVFKYRNYSPTMQRWTTADPSGFPDGANNYLYSYNSPIFILDNNGLTGKSVLWVYAWSSNSFNLGQSNEFNQEFSDLKSQMELYDSLYFTEESKTHYLDDGDKFEFRIVSSLYELMNITDYNQIYIAAHGTYTLNGTEDIFENRTYTGKYQIGSHQLTEMDFISYNMAIQMVYGCNATYGDVNAFQIASMFREKTMSYLFE